MNRLVSESSGTFDSAQFNWEEDASPNRKKIAPPEVDEIFMMESTELAKPIENVSEKEIFLK